MNSDLFIEYDEKEEKKKQLQQLLLVERDLSLLTDLFKEYNNIVKMQGETLNQMKNNVETTNEQIEKSNQNLVETIEIKKDIMKSKTMLAAVGLTIINLPVGVVFGTHALLASFALSGLGAGIWIMK